MISRTSTVGKINNRLWTYHDHQTGHWICVEKTGLYLACMSLASILPYKIVIKAHQPAGNSGNDA